MAITPRDITIGPRPDLQMVLQEYSVEAEQEGYVALAIAPELPIPFAEGTLKVEKIKDSLREARDERNGDGTYVQISTQFGNTSVATAEYGGEVHVDTNFANMYREWEDAEIAATLLARRSLARNHQRRVIDAALSIANTDAATGGLNLSGTDVFAEFTGWKKAVRAQCGRVPNVFACEWEVYEDLRQHPDLLDRIKYSGQHSPALKSLNRQLLAEVLDLDEVIVSTAMKDTGNEAKAVSLSPRWDKTKALLFVRNNSPVASDVSFMKTVTWDEDGGSAMQTDGQSYMGVAMESYLDDRRRGVVYRNRGQYAAWVSHADAALLITGAWVAPS